MFRKRKAQQLHQAIKNGNNELVYQLCRDIKIARVEIEQGGEMYNALDVALANHEDGIISHLVRHGVQANKFINKFRLQQHPEVTFRKVGTAPFRKFKYSYLLNTNISEADKLKLLNRWIKHDPHFVNSSLDYNHIKIPLIEAVVRAGTPEMMGVLLRNGVKFPNNLLQTIVNSKTGHALSFIRQIKYSVENSQAPLIQDNNKALHYALARNKPELVRELLPLPFQANYHDDANHSFLENAFVSCPAALSELSKVMDINQPNKNGYTLLHKLVMIAEGPNSYNQAILRLGILRDCAADPFKRSAKEGLTAYQLARLKNKHQLAEHLKRWQLQYRTLSPDDENFLQNQDQEVARIQKKITKLDINLNRDEKIELAGIRFKAKKDLQQSQPASDFLPPAATSTHCIVLSKTGAPLCKTTIENYKAEESEQFKIDVTKVTPPANTFFVFNQDDKNRDRLRAVVKDDKTSCEIKIKVKPINSPDNNNKMRL